MDIQKITQALTDGLLAGYGGKSNFSTTTRGSFELKSSHFATKDMVYHDEWTSGGGQEIVRVGNDEFTRVYAGPVPDLQALTKLGISDDEVLKNLISRLQQLGDKTRLFEDCLPEDTGDWGYEYKILDRGGQISITTGKETITYKNEIVFIHVFVLSPVNK
jgi:hypothetical protein